MEIPSNVTSHEPPMEATITGLHHVTAVTGDAQANLDFYCGLLGLRLVKLTINFDDPQSYHLYFGDELGWPGSVVTFFAWPDAARGRPGPPQVLGISLAVPAAALAFWFDRLAGRNVAAEHARSCFGEPVVSFADPDGMDVKLVGIEGSTTPGPSGGPIEPKYAIRGLHHVAIAEEGHELTARLLKNVLGFRADGSEGGCYRFRSDAPFASSVYLLCMPGAPRGTLGAGIVHHVAFRTPSDAQQRAWRTKLVQKGFNVSPIMDRKYFQSIYFREPGGVLFEIATDEPGFTVDEPPAQLGAALQLPEQFEAARGQLEQSLPRLKLPAWRGATA